MVIFVSVIVSIVLGLLIHKLGVSRGRFQKNLEMCDFLDSIVSEDDAAVIKRALIQELKKDASPNEHS